MKKIACLLLYLGSQMASAAPSSFTGTYLTGGIGATSTQFNVTPNVGVDEIDFRLDGDFDMYATSPYGLIGLSYLYQFKNHFVLGAEVTAGYARTDVETQPSFMETFPGVFFDLSSDVQGRLTNDFALLFKPGYVSRTNTLFYLLVGPRWGNFETSVHTNVGVDSGGGLYYASGEAKKSGYECGFTAGIGIQQQFMENMHLSLEYAYTDYRAIDAPSVNAHIFNGGADTGFLLVDTPEIEPSTNTVMLAFSYQWK